MDLVSQLRASLSSSSLPPPSTTFITQLITSRNPPLPLPSLLATAKARLLSADLTSTSTFDHTSSLSCFPPDFDNPHTKEAKLPHGVHVQVLDVENLSISRWEQIEELEAIERGERTRGREVIQVLADEEQTTMGEGGGEGGLGRASSTTTAAGRGAATTGGSSSKNATHRLVLQDGKGKKLFGMELARIDKIGVGKTFIGEKIWLRPGTVVARGTVLMTPEQVLILGGKVDAWHKTWVETRLTRLKESVGSDRPD